MSAGLSGYLPLSVQYLGFLPVLFSPGHQVGNLVTGSGIESPYSNDRAFCGNWLAWASMATAA